MSGVLISRIQFVKLIKKMSNVVSCLIRRILNWRINQILEGPLALCGIKLFVDWNLLMAFLMVTNNHMLIR